MNSSPLTSASVNAFPVIKDRIIPNYLIILLHEISHFIAHKSKTKLANKGEEGIAEFIGSEFSKIFLQNPKLINIIKHWIKKNENN